MRLGGQMIGASKFLSPTAVGLAAGWAAISAAPALADVVHADDVMIQSSLCVGFDCLDGEVFNFATIRLKENNTRIDFQDTSTGSFPLRDWRIEANSSASGGASYLAMKDMGDAATGVEGGTALLTVTAGAPANSVFVASTGRVGFRTATPVLDLHAATSNTPGIRLEQNGSGGFTPQTWDIAGNEANFFVRDVTGGSRLPLRIRPGAPTSSIDIAASGNVGVGTASPDVRLHVRHAGSGPTNILRVENTGGNPEILMENGANGNIWEMSAGANDIVRLEGGSNLMALSTTGDLNIAGEITTSGSCSVGYDRVFSPDYPLPTIGEHAEMMFANGYLPAVGPTVEGNPMNLTLKVEGILNELEKAHIYIAQMEERLAVLEGRRSAPAQRAKPD
jgi:hypothetical protein